MLDLAGRRDGAGERGGGQTGRPADRWDGSGPRDAMDAHGGDGAWNAAAAT